MSNNTGTTHYDSLQGSYWADQKDSYNEKQEILSCISDAKLNKNDVQIESSQKTVIAKAKLHILTVTILSPWRLTKPNILHMLITGRSYTSSPSTYIVVNTPYSFFFLSLLLTLQMWRDFLVASLDASNVVHFSCRFS